MIARGGGGEAVSQIHQPHRVSRPGGRRQDRQQTREETARAPAHHLHQPPPWQTAGEEAVERAKERAAPVPVAQMRQLVACRAVRGDLGPGDHRLRPGAAAWAGRPRLGHVLRLRLRHGRHRRGCARRRRCSRPRAVTIARSGRHCRAPPARSCRCSRDEHQASHSAPAFGPDPGSRGPARGPRARQRRGQRPARSHSFGSSKLGAGRCRVDVSPRRLGRGLPRYGRQGSR